MENKVHFMTFSKHTFPLTANVMKAVELASPHIGLVVQGGTVIAQQYINDIEKAAKDKGIPTIAYRSQSRIAVGLSMVRVRPYQVTAKDTKMEHAAMNYSTLIMDQPFELHSSDVPLSEDESLGMYMATRVKSLKR